MSSLLSSISVGRTQTNSELLAISGPISAVVFAFTNIVFTVCATDSYSYAKQMVSDLGAAGAPKASIFNFFGFILPGLLVVALAFGLKRELRVSGAPASLGLCGILLMTVGFFPLQSTLAGNIIHVTAGHLAGLAFVVAAVLLSTPMRKHPSFNLLGRVTPGLIFLLILNAADQLEWTPPGFLAPGWGERFTLIGFFAWLALAGLSLLASIRQRRVAHRASAFAIPMDQTAQLRG
jgi:hypothetical membrane protein